jgi:hypothetical protein
MFQMVIIYNKQHFPFRGPPDFTKTGIFGLKTNHLATLAHTKPIGKVFSSLIGFD